MRDFTLGDQHLFGSKLRMQVEHVRVMLAVVQANGKELAQNTKELENAYGDLSKESGSALGLEVPELVRTFHNYLLSATSLAEHALALKSTAGTKDFDDEYRGNLEASGLRNIGTVVRALRHFAGHVRAHVPIMCHEGGSGSSVIPGRLVVEFSKLCDWDGLTVEQRQGLAERGWMIGICTLVEEYEAANSAFYDGLFKCLERKYPQDMSRELPNVSPFCFYR